GLHRTPPDPSTVSRTNSLYSSCGTQWTPGFTVTSLMLMSLGTTASNSRTLWLNCHRQPQRCGQVRVWFAHHPINRPPLKPTHQIQGLQRHDPTPTDGPQHYRYPTIRPPGPRQCAVFHLRKSLSHPPPTRPDQVADGPPPRSASSAPPLQLPGYLHQNVPSPEVSRVLGHQPETSNVVDRGEQTLVLPRQLPTEHAHPLVPPPRDGPHHHHPVILHAKHPQ